METYLRLGNVLPNLIYIILIYIISDTGHVQPPACQDTHVVLMFFVNVKKFLSFSQEIKKESFKAAYSRTDLLGF